MKRKSVYNSQSVENFSDQILRSEVQPAQTNVSTAKGVRNGGLGLTPPLELAIYKNFITCAKGD